MAKAVWNGTVIAESDETVEVEGNHYFPPDSVDRRYLVESATHTTCPWKGVASYYDIQVDGTLLPAAAWYYRQPKEKAAQIKDHIAFYPHKVTVEQL